jgi:signal transduction histidine kinase
MLAMWAALVGFGLLVVLAIAADRDAGLSRWSVAIDAAVGVVFVLAALASPGRAVPRLAIGAVGPAWLLGSVLPGVRTLHQAVLLLAIIAYRPTRHGRVWVGACLAVAVAMSVFAISQLVVAVLFLVAGVAAVSGPSPRARRSLFPVVAGAALAAIVAALWWDTQRFDGLDPAVRLILYEVVLIAVAVAWPVTRSAQARAWSRLADLLVEQTPLTGVEGLADVLRRTLGDPTLSVDVLPTQLRLAAGSRVLVVAEQGVPVAELHHRSLALADRDTADAVAVAVRLAVANARLQDDERRRLDELEAARVRLLAAADLQRSQMAGQLQQDVYGRLAVASSRLSAVRASLSAGEAAAALDIAAGEVSAASREIAGFVDGAPLGKLGAGRLAGVLASLAQACPVPVELVFVAAANADVAAENTVFYVCAEALANAAKHSAATRVTCTVESAADGSLIATVHDDGRGGADLSGAGLQGLADRVSAAGGRLRVVSPPGAGTTVTAHVPVSRSSSKP